MLEKTEEIGKIIRVCDICGDRSKINTTSLQYSRKYRHRQRDLCISCGTKEFYRINPPPVGSQSPRWKGGLSNGYQIVYWRDTKTGEAKKEREHRLVMQKEIRRDLVKGEVVHHLDMNKVNNNVSNLSLCRDEHQHQCLHSSLEQCGFDFLEELIWFDCDIGRYVIYRCPIRDEACPSVDGLMSIGGNLQYQFCRLPHAKNARLFHILLTEKRMGRKLYRDEVVHHINGNSLDNEINNLFVMTISEHSLAHKSMQQCAAVLFQNGNISFQDGEYVSHGHKKRDRKNTLLIEKIREDNRRYKKADQKVRQTSAETSLRYRRKNNTEDDGG